MLVVIGISASYTSSKYQMAAKNQIGAHFSLSLNMDNFYQRIDELEAKGYDLTYTLEPPASPLEMKAPPNFEFMTLFQKDIEQLAKIEGIADYNIEAMMNPLVKAINFKRIESPFPNENEIPEVSLRGVRNMSLLSIVQNGNISLKEGRWIEANDVKQLVISEELAELNQLQLGDYLIVETLPLKNFGMATIRERQGIQEPDSVVMEGEIVGIFRNNRSISFNPGVVSQQSENQIFTALDFAKVGIHEDDPFYETATFHVENMEQFEEIRLRLESVNINWERYELWGNQDTVETLSPTFEQLKETGRLLLIVVVVSGFGILSLAFAFLIKGRSKEIAIWVSLGNSKKEIIAQFFCESALILVVALGICVVTIPATISLAEGYFSENTELTIQDDLLDSELTIPEQGNEKDRIELIVDSQTIILSTSGIMALMILSIIVAMLPILRLKPREIFVMLS